MPRRQASEDYGASPSSSPLSLGCIIHPSSSLISIHPPIHQPLAAAARWNSEYVSLPVLPKPSFFSLTCQEPKIRQTPLFFGGGGLTRSPLLSGLLLLPPPRRSRRGFALADESICFSKSSHRICRRIRLHLGRCEMGTKLGCDRGGISRGAH